MFHPRWARKEEAMYLNDWKSGGLEEDDLGKAGYYDNEFANELRTVLDALEPNVHSAS